ncbi:hypothetical protein [Desulfobacter postgatei]|uniref:hypothetical protein n=1 Tax=Desulfobacter postgatei TaxID=2293 RepID=UPI00259B5285|nr:hypothetical protein [uncultured Desulfobacter sp.]
MNDIQTKHEDVYGKYVFNEDEKKEMAEQMARAFSEKTDLEMKKKEVTSQIKGEIDAVDAKISTLSRDYNQGHKFMNIPCRVEYDFKKKEVRVYRKDTGDRISVRTMTQNEFQQEMFDKNGHSITSPEENTDDQIMFEDESLETVRS